MYEKVFFSIQIHYELLSVKGNLPIALIFDFPDNQNNASEIIGLSTKYGVYISLRQKQRQSTLAIVVKGVEKFIGRQHIFIEQFFKFNLSLHLTPCLIFCDR